MRQAAMIIVVAALAACGGSEAGVASVSLTAPSATLGLGATVQLQAAPRSAEGEPLAGRALTWTTSAAAIATVSFPLTSEGTFTVGRGVITLWPAGVFPATPIEAVVRADVSMEVRWRARPDLAEATFLFAPPVEP